MADKATRNKKEKPKEETEKRRAEEVEGFIKDLWGKVVEYASLGAEEATKVSSTAKMRVDIETLKFKRGKLAKLLGERYFAEWLNDPSMAVKGTKEILRQVKQVDSEIQKLEKDINKARSKTKTKAKAKAKTTRKKTTPKTKPTEKKTTTRKRTAPAKSKPEPKRKAAPPAGKSEEK